MVVHLSVLPANIRASVLGMDHRHTNIGELLEGLFQRKGLHWKIRKMRQAQ